MGATDGNLTVTFSGIVMSFGVAGVLKALGAEDEGDGSTVEVEPSSAEDEPSPNKPLSFPEHNQQTSTQAATGHGRTRKRIIFDLSIRDRFGHGHKARLGE